MKLPPIISAATISALSTTDTHAVRIILMSASGPTNFTLRGNGRRKGKYILKRDGTLGRHILDIPVSIWNDGMPSGRFTDNASISNDLMSKPDPLNPFVTVIVPWNGAVESQSEMKPSVEILDAVETLTLRMLSVGAMASAFDKCATPEIKACLDRECGPIISAFLHSSGRKEFVKFIHKLMDCADSENQQSPADATTTAPAITTEEPKTETAAAKRMREKRARDKAAKEKSEKLQAANA